MIQSQANIEFSKAFEPLAVNGELKVNKNGFVEVYNSVRQITTNSLLRKDEWEELDRQVIKAQEDRLNAIARLQTLGLVKRFGSIGTVLSQWNVVSEMARAEVSITGRGNTDKDRVDYNLASVPVPVIHKEYALGERELAASRRFGDGIDASNAYAASQVVAEELERMFYDGDATISLSGNPIYGATTHPDRNTGTASGDFGTISNIYSTYIKAIKALGEATTVLFKV